MGLKVDVPARLDGRAGAPVDAGMDLFGGHGPAQEFLGHCLALGLGHGDISRVHLFDLEVLAPDGRVEIIFGRADPAERLEMIGGVDLFGVGVGLEGAGDVRQFLRGGLIGKGQVLDMGLAFAGEGGLDVFFGHFLHV